jgi:CubicO group peptidase (beta-lactamase class C family)
MDKKALGQSLAFIKSWLRFRYEREEIPGFVVAVSHAGELMMNEAYGYADLEGRTPLTPQHIFRIASHSKTFTATSLMQLQEQEKLHIDDPVAMHISWIKDHSDGRWHKVTLRQLMSHSAGVLRDGLDADYWQLEQPFPDEDELRAIVLGASLVIDPSTKFKYSNIGYALLGMVIEAVSGQTYNDYVAEHIVARLGLNRTGPDFTPTIKRAVATGYARRDTASRLPIAHINTHSMSPATGFYATAEDLCDYFTAQFIGSGELLGDTSKKEMQRKQWDMNFFGQSDQKGYGLGFEIDYLQGRQMIGHGGGFPGYTTRSIADPLNELVVVVLTNCVNGPATEIVKGIYTIIDYYQNNSAYTGNDMKKFGGRYMNLRTVVDIVIAGDTIAVVSPDTSQPLLHPRKLDYMDESTLRVVDAASFDGEGELIHFYFNDNKVESIRYCGMTMWPETVWTDKQNKREIIG